ncbi:TPA: alpha-1,2-fucosyltransferase [Streptococcus suis]|nr:alpha-1,2-fucosyltransferase [Streptococcus suis]
MKKVITNIQGTRFGNHLYFYLFANKEKDVFIEYVEDMEYWNQYFPQLNNLIIKKNFQNLEVVQPNKTFFQNYGQDFSGEDLRVFIDEFLKNDLLNLLKSKNSSFDCIINIRRGDFYTSEHRYLYGFDQVRYVEDCLLQMSLDSNASIAIISDDIDWCEENLSILTKRFQNVEFLRLSPIDAFLECINAKQLIITNSTFSYWAAYLNTYLAPEHSIFAPNYNTNKIKNGKQISAQENWVLVPVTVYRSLVFESKLKLRQNLREVKNNLKGFYSTLNGKRKY